MATVKTRRLAIVANLCSKGPPPCSLLPPVRRIASRAVLCEPSQQIRLPERKIATEILAARGPQASDNPTLSRIRKTGSRRRALTYPTLEMQGMHTRLLPESQKPSWEYKPGF